LLFFKYKDVVVKIFCLFVTDL